MTEKINWHDYFYYDETSPSCLRWSCDSLRGRGYSSFARRVGDVVGTNKGTTGRWQTILNRKHVLIHRIIYEMFHGSIADGLFVDHIDGDYSNNKISNLRVVERELNARNSKINANNITGVTGTHLTTNYDKHGEPYYYFTATWHDLDKKTKSKHFPIARLGYEEAFRLACEYRAKMIAELNEQGAGYTERHGT